MQKLVIILFGLCTMIFSCYTQAINFKEYKVPSSALTNPQTVSVSLPIDYINNQSYPVIYVLNTDSFYAGKFRDDFVHRIRQLEGYKQTPPSILIFIDNTSWYSTLFDNTNALSQFLAFELPRFIQDKYQTTDSHLFAHSYAAAYLLNQSPELQKGFTYLNAISAVFPDTRFVQETAKKILQLDNRKGLVTLYQEIGHLSDTQILQDLADNVTTFKQQIVSGQDHQSIVPIAISIALRSHYKDFVAADYLNQFNLDKTELTQQFKAIRNKYQQPTSEEDLKDFYSAMAQNKMELQQLDLAFTLWQDASPRFRHYFINRWGDRYLAKNKRELARKTWLQLSKLYPQSPFAWHKLAILAKAVENFSEHQIALQGLAEAAEKFSVHDQQMFLAFISSHGTAYPELVPRILKRILQHSPEHKEAKQQLDTISQQQNTITKTE